MNTRSLLLIVTFFRCAAQQEELTYTIQKTPCTRAALVLANFDEILSRSSGKFSKNYTDLKSAQYNLAEDKTVLCKSSELHASKAAYWFQREVLRKSSPQEIVQASSTGLDWYKKARRKGELSKVNNTSFITTITMPEKTAQMIASVVILDEIRSRGVSADLPNEQAIREQYARICSHDTMKARCKGMYHSDRAMAQQISTEDLVARLQEMRK